MSQEEHQAGTADPSANPFEREEVAQFDADDVQAGRAIGKMLSLFFIYTLVAMSIVALWTFTTIFQ